MHRSNLKPSEGTSTSNSDQEASLASPALPVSGGMPTPATQIGSICPCEQHADACDSDCCCDTACGEHVATGCSLISLSGSKQLCSRDVASYSLGIANGVDGLSHPSPDIPTDSNFDSLFQNLLLFSAQKEAVVRSWTSSCVWNHDSRWGCSEHQ